MGIESIRRWLGWALGPLVLGLACSAMAQKLPSAEGVRWFDGTEWRTVPPQALQNAPGGVIVSTEPALAAALAEALAQRGLPYRRLAVQGAFELPSPPGAGAMALTHRLRDLPVPVTIEPVWRTPVR